MLRPGVLVRTGRFEHHQPAGDGKHENKFGYKPANRGDRFNFIYLGVQRKGEPEIDAEQFLRSMGWIPASEVEK